MKGYKDLATKHEGNGQEDKPKWGLHRCQNKSKYEDVDLKKDDE
jgi:hypothetical protein